MFLPIALLLGLNTAIVRALKRRFTHHESQRKSMPARIREVYRQKFFKPRKVRSALSSFVSKQN